MKAMIMAAGFGMRMRPLTDTIPKPLVQVAGKPLIDYAINFLAAGGVKNIVVNSHYLAEMLEAYLPSHVTISHENEALETGGGIKNALPLLGNEPFFVVNSDVICIDIEGHSPALTRLAQNFDEQKMDAILLLHEVRKAIGYNGKGDFFVEKDGSLRRRNENETAPLVFTGIQLIHPRLFANSPNGKFSLNVLYNKDLSRIGAIIHEGEWLHIGSEEELAIAEEFFKVSSLRGGVSRRSNP